MTTAAVDVVTRELENVCKKVQYAFTDGKPTKTATLGLGDVPEVSKLDALWALDQSLTPQVRASPIIAQRKLENLLVTKVVTKCSNLPLRELIGSCLLKVVRLADNKPANDVATSLKVFLVDNQTEGREAPMYVMGLLIKELGRSFASGQFTEMLAIILKLLKSSRSEVPLRETCLFTLQQLLLLSSGETLTDVVRILQRLMTDTAPAVRRAVAACLPACISASGEVLKDFDTLLPMALKGLGDAELDVRLEYAATVASVLTLVVEYAPAVSAKDKAAAKNAVKRVYKVDGLLDGISTLTTHFNATGNATERAAVAQTLVVYLNANQARVTDQNVAECVQAIMAALASRAEWTDADGRQAAKCIAHVLRQSLLSFLKEQWLELATKELLKVLSAHALAESKQRSSVNEYQLLCALQELGFVFAQLGASVEESDIRKPAVDAICPLLADSKLWVRIHAAQCLRQLTRAAPSQAADWIRIIHSVFFIHLAEVDPEASGDDPDINIVTIYTIHGHVHALAALLGIVPELPSGIPSKLINDIFEGARKVFALPCGATDSPGYQSLRSLREAAWLLMGSLISLAADPEWVLAHGHKKHLFDLWKDALATRIPDPKLRASANAEKDLHVDLKVRTQALMALRAFVSVYREELSNPMMSSVLRTCVLLLSKTVQTLQQLSAADKELREGAPPPPAAPTNGTAAGAGKSGGATANILAVSVDRTLSGGSDMLEPNPSPTHGDSLGAGVASTGGAAGRGYSRAIQGAITSLRAVLMDVFVLLPPSSYQNLHVSLMTIAASEFVRGTALATELRKLLTPEDCALDPEDWNLSQPHTVALATLAQKEESILLNYTWAWSSFPLDRDDNSSVIFGEAFSADAASGGGAIGDTAEQELRTRDAYGSPTIRALNSCIRLFGALFVLQTPQIKEQLVQHFAAVYKKARPTDPTSASPDLHPCAVHNIATTLLCIARQLVQTERRVNSPGALNEMLTLLFNMLSHSRPAVQRAAAECIALLCRVEGDALTGECVKKLGEKISVRDKPVVAAAAFALGCVHRAVGPMKSLRHLEYTVALLQLLGRDYSDPFRSWILHALYLTVDTGGLSLSTYLTPAVSLLYGHALNDRATRSVSVTQSLARVVKGLLAALGPEIASNDANNSANKFLAIWSHVKNDPAPVVQLEVLQCVHQFVLWAPKFADLPSLFPMVLSALYSPLPSLQLTALRCLRTWVEKDPTLVLTHNLESRFFALLEGPTAVHSAVRKQLKNAFRNMIAYFVPAPLAVQPPAAPAGAQAVNMTWRLLDVCKRCIVGSHRLPSDALVARAAAAALAASTPAGNNKKPAGATPLSKGGKTPVTKGGKTPALNRNNSVDDEDADMKGGANDQDDDDTDQIYHDDDQDGPSAAPTGASAGGAGAAGAVSERTEARLRTKVFAARCIELILATAQTSPNTVNEFDPVVAREDGKRFYIVTQLNDLITVACMAAGSSFERLRIRGLHLIHRLLLCFSSALDPESLPKAGKKLRKDDVPAELLLTQYQAQLTSTLRQCLQPDASDASATPTMRAVACQAITELLHSGISSDKLVLQRFIRLLAGLLQNRSVLSQWAQVYDGRAITSVLLAHLAALSDLQYAMKHKPSSRAGHVELLVSVMAPELPALQAAYMGAVRDSALVFTQPAHAMRKITGSLFDGPSCTGLSPVFQRYWPSLLRASLLTLSPPSTPLPEGDAAVMLSFSLFALKYGLLLGASFKLGNNAPATSTAASAASSGKPSVATPPRGSGKEEERANGGSDPLISPVVVTAIYGDDEAMEDRDLVRDRDTLAQMDTVLRETRLTTCLASVRAVLSAVKSGHVSRGSAAPGVVDMTSLQSLDTVAEAASILRTCWSSPAFVMGMDGSGSRDVAYVSAVEALVAFTEHVTSQQQQQQHAVDGASTGAITAVTELVTSFLQRHVAKWSADDGPATGDGDDDDVATPSRKGLPTNASASSSGIEVVAPVQAPVPVTRVHRVLVGRMLTLLPSVVRSACVVSCQDDEHKDSAHTQGTSDAAGDVISQLALSLCALALHTLRRGGVEYVADAAVAVDGILRAGVAHAHTPPVIALLHRAAAAVATSARVQLRSFHSWSLDAKSADVDAAVTELISARVRAYTRVMMTGLQVQSIASSSASSDEAKQIYHTSLQDALQDYTSFFNSTDAAVLQDAPRQRAALLRQALLAGLQDTVLSSASSSSSTATAAARDAVNAFVPTAFSAALAPLVASDGEQAVKTIMALYASSTGEVKLSSLTMVAPVLLMVLTANSYQSLSLLCVQSIRALLVTSGKDAVTAAVQSQSLPPTSVTIFARLLAAEASSADPSPGAASSTAAASSSKGSGAAAGKAAPAAKIHRREVDAEALAPSIDFSKFGARK